MVAVPTIQVKNVPIEVHRTLRQRAANAGQSLQEYLRALLSYETSRPTFDEVLDRVEQRTGGDLTFSAAVDLVRRDRGE